MHGENYRASCGERLAQGSGVMEARPMKRIGILSAAALLLLLGYTAPAFGRQEKESQPAKQEPKAEPAKQQPEAKPAKQQEAKPAKPEEAKPAKQQEAKPAKAEPKAKTAKQEEPKPAKAEPKAKTAKQQEAKPAKAEQKTKTAKQEEPKPAKTEPRAKTAKQEEAKPEKRANTAKSTKQEQQQQARSTKQEEPAKGAGGRPVRTAEAQQRQNAEPPLRLSTRGDGRIPDDRFRANFGQSHLFVINSPVMVGGYSRFQYGGFWFGFVEPWPEGWYYTDDVYVDFIDGGYYLCNPYFPGARVSISVVI